MFFCGKNYLSHVNRSNFFPRATLSPHPPAPSPFDGEGEEKRCERGLENDHRMYTLSFFLFGKENPSVPIGIETAPLKWEPYDSVVFCNGPAQHDYPYYECGKEKFSWAGVDHSGPPCFAGDQQLKIRFISFNYTISQRRYD